MRYKVFCPSCLSHPIGEYKQYDLYYCKCEPADNINCIAYYDNDTGVHGREDCYTTIDIERVVESRPVMYLMFTFYILNNLGDS